MKYFENPKRVSHTLSKSPSLHNVPHTTDRKPNATHPAPVTPKTRRCASCGGGNRSFR